MAGVPSPWNNTPEASAAYLEGYKVGVQDAVADSGGLLTNMDTIIAKVNSNRPLMGVHISSTTTGPTSVNTHNVWLGVPNDISQTFNNYNNWTAVQGDDTWYDAWRDWVYAEGSRNVIIGLPLIADPYNNSGVDGIAGNADDNTLANIAAGNFDTNFQAFADRLNSKRLKNSYIRIGWEMDGAAYPWRASQSETLQKKLDYAAAFRRVVDVMRARQPSNGFKFVWSVGAAWWLTSYLDDVYPGDAYVDYVGLTMFDQTWVQENGVFVYPYPVGADASEILRRQQVAWNDELFWLNAIKNFAATHGKPMCLPEWGCITRGDGRGGADNPYFIQQMYNFIHNVNNNVAFHCYWERTSGDGDSRLSNAGTVHPNAAAKYQELFGNIG